MNQINLLKPERGELVIGKNVRETINFSNGVSSLKDINISLKGNEESITASIKAKKTLISHLFLYYQIPLNEEMKIMGSLYLSLVMD